MARNKGQTRHQNELNQPQRRDKPSKNKIQGLTKHFKRLETRPVTPVGFLSHPLIHSSGSMDLPLHNMKTLIDFWRQYFQFRFLKIALFDRQIHRPNKKYL